MKVMLYIRPKAKAFFCQVANKVFDHPTLVTYSDFNRIADVWAGQYIYSEKYDAENERFEKEAPDILPRCRTLRKMPHELAYKLARRYWNGMEEFFEEQRFDYVFLLPPDCYTLDIIARVAAHKGVRVISFLGSPFAGYARMTLRGEYNQVRDDVGDDEIAPLVEKMTQVAYLSPSEVKNVQKTHRSIYKFHIRRFLIEHFYNPLLKLRDGDPWNYHYNIYEVKGIPLKARFDKAFDARFKRLADIEFDPATTVYYPMHLIPEATTDYWCPDVRVADYHNFILRMIKEADPRITLIIKEHPAMYGRRMLSFYDQLNALPNVILLHPMDRSNELLLKIENVVVDNGTVGVEALMRGKRVLVLSDNYYYRFHPNAFAVDSITMDALQLPLREHDNRQFMRRLLEGCFPSDFRNSRNGIPSSNPDQAASGVRQYIKQNQWPLA